MAAVTRCTTCDFDLSDSSLGCSKCGFSLLLSDAQAAKWRAAKDRVGTALRSVAEAEVLSQEAAKKAIEAKTLADARVDDAIAKHAATGTPADLRKMNAVMRESMEISTSVDLAASDAALKVIGAQKEISFAQIALKSLGKKFESAHVYGEMMAAAEASRAARAAEDIEWQRDRKKMQLKARFILPMMLTVGISIPVGFVYLVFRKTADVPAPYVARIKGEPLGLDESSAQVFCEENIRRVAKDPDTVKVPFVLNRGQSGTYEFNWDAQTSLVRMRNGLGLEVAVRASCTVNSATGKIMSLTVDGQKLI